jgi:O-antigen/teichoic acid export membrane protein
VAQRVRPSGSELQSRVIRSTGWLAAARLGTQGVSWAATLLLARFLTPQDYGLFAMALATLAFLQLFQECGLGTAIIQRPDITPEQLNAVFWIVASTSLGITLIGALGAPLAAAFYREPRLVGTTRVLALIFLLNALGMIPYNLLTRTIEFPRRSLAEVSGVIAGVSTSLPLAYLGHGVWALVLGHLAGALVRNGALIMLCGWFPAPAVSFGQVRGMLAFGLRLSAVEALGTVSTALNRMIIGRFTGSLGLGLFAMADTLSTGAHRISTSLVNQFSLPVFSAIQEDEAVLRRSFLRLSKYLAVVAVPAQVGLALVASDLVRVLLSGQWLAMIGLLKVLCLAGIAYVLPLPVSALLTARGRAQTLLRLAGLATVLSAAAFLAGSPLGLAGIAAAWIVVYPPFRVYLLWLGLRELRIAPRQYVECIGPSLVAVTAMALAVLSMQALLAPPSGWVSLALSAIVGGLAYIPLIALMDKPLRAEVRALLVRSVAPSKGATA